MKDVILSILEFLGGLGIFLYGMKVMSEGIQKIAGERLATIVSNWTRTRFHATMAGFVITSFIQSSSATTVLTVSFVNAGLMKLRTAIAVILGTNIGTTVTAILIAFVGFHYFSISQFSLVILGLAVPVLFVGVKAWQTIGEVFVGFSLLFLGLGFMKQVVPAFEDQPETLELLLFLGDHGLTSLLIFVCLGGLFSLIMQSSSAAISMTMILLFNGWITIEWAAAMVLGENIGTTVTANIAAIVGNSDAKRAAFAHTLVNLLGVLWALFALPILLNGAEFLTAAPLSGNDSGIVQSRVLALFHVMYNIINVMILFWFVPQIERLVNRMYKKTEVSGPGNNVIVNTGLIETPESSLLEARHLIDQLAVLDYRMFKRMTKIVLADTESDSHENIKIEFSEQKELVDSEIMKLSRLLRKVSQSNLTEDGARKCMSMQSMLHDLERIAFSCLKSISSEDVKDNLGDKKNKKGIKKLFKLVDQAFTIMLVNLKLKPEEVNIDEVYRLESKINELRDELRLRSAKNAVKKKEFEEIGIGNRRMYSTLEKIGDHIYSVNQAIIGRK